MKVKFSFDISIVSHSLCCQICYMAEYVNVLHGQYHEAELTFEQRLTRIIDDLIKIRSKFRGPHVNVYTLTR
jgi:hypothetical protein